MQNQASLYLCPVVLFLWECIKLYWRDERYSSKRYSLTWPIHTESITSKRQDVFQFHFNKCFNLHWLHQRHVKLEPVIFSPSHVSEVSNSVEIIKTMLSIHCVPSMLSRFSVHVC